MKNENNITASSSWTKLIVISTIFGLMGGLVGALLGKIYIIDRAYNIPLFNDVNLSETKQGPNIIIRDAKKVVVEQNAKVAEVINSAGNSMVGIYKKLPADNPNDKSVISKSSYNLKDRVGQAVVITSDGWLVGAFTMTEKSALTDYVAITKDGQVLPLNQSITDARSGLNYIHATVHGLPVMKFANREDVQTGQIVIGTNWDGDNYQTTIKNFANRIVGATASSDVANEKIVLSSKGGGEFKGSAIFGVGGDLLGFINKDNEIEPVYNNQSMVKSLLQFGRIHRPSLGVNYVNLSGWVGVKPDKGALIAKSADGVAIAKGSPADTAGLKEGDIITSIDNIEINRDANLSNLINQFLPGEKIVVTYTRSGQSLDADVILGELK